MATTSTPPNATPEQPLELGAGLKLGSLACVDSDRMIVELSDPKLSSHVTVSDLVAVPAEDGFLVGLVEGVARQVDKRIEARIMPVGTFHPSAGGSGSFRLGASRHPHLGAGCHLVEGTNLTRFMSVLGEDVPEEERLLLGRYLADRASTAIADGNRLLQRHMAILGTTGTGKSWSVALLLERAARLQHANILVLDLHGEYAPLAQASEEHEAVARQLRVAGPADLLYAADAALHVPFWLLERDELASLILSESDPHAGDQRLWLTDRIQTLKRSTLSERGGTAGLTTATADSPVPYQLEHLLEWAQRDEVEIIVRHPSGRVDPGPFAGKLGGLISRLEARLADPRYAFIFQPPEAATVDDWLLDTAQKLLSAGPADMGIKIIDLSEVPAPILPMVAGVLVRLVYNIQFWMDPAQRTPVCVVCDEAHTYLPADRADSPVHRVALGAFETIAKEGRKYGVCLAVVSQRPSDVSRTILSQCNNFMIMRLTNDQDQDVVSRVVPGTLTAITGLLPLLDVGETIVVGDALMLPLRIKLDAPDRRPTSATLPYWSMWSTQASSYDAISAGVEALRHQWRGD
ncbi:MAG TPA: ATP-binding protein [Solirubrobacteraceae bacterium]|nr:ATP-binding protein [Solirubrobacteraceae bacterium]